MSLEQDLAHLASGQHGLLTRSQLRELGLSSRAIDHRLEHGRLSAVHPEVYLVGGSARNKSQELLAAVLSMGRGAALSHLSAAGLWGMLSVPSLIHVVTPRPRWKDKPFIVHRSTDLGPRYVVEVDGIPVTTPARTVVDLGAVVGRRTVGLALDTAIRKNLTSLPEVGGMIDRVARKGRRGVGHARTVLEERLLWQNETESVLEDLFRQVVSDAGLPSPTPQVRIRNPIGQVVARVDFAYPTHRLAIELDGFRYHSDPDAFVKDRARQNAVLSAGYRVLRYTAKDLREAPFRVVAEVSRLLHEPVRASS
jgi:very-short-patch-repair endonuclease